MTLTDLNVREDGEVDHQKLMFDDERIPGHPLPIEVRCPECRGRTGALEPGH